MDESKLHEHNEKTHQEQPVHTGWDNGGAPSGGFDFDSYAHQGNGGAHAATQRQGSSSEEEDDDKSKFPMIQIDMSSYGY